MRRQRPRGSTTREAVVAAALAVAAQDGVDGLTIRAVADRVGAPAMSLYTHFRNKHELLDLMLAEIAARIYVCESHPTWQGEMLALCRRVYRLLSGHSAWLALLSRPVWPVGLPAVEHILELMAVAGIPAEEGRLAVTSATLTAIGLVLVEPALTGPEGKCVFEKERKYLSDRTEMPDGGSDPEARAGASEIRRVECDRLFELTIAALVRGFESKRAAA